MRSRHQAFWSTVVLGCFTALAFLVLSYSPVSLSATAAGDCVVSPQSQAEGLCCVCDDYAICGKVEFGTYDRCEGGMPPWCPDEENCGVAH
jgi:hypothetical protein